MYGIYGEWPSVAQNALGPFKPLSDITTTWHNGLFKAMDELTPQLNKCRDKYDGTIPYSMPRKYGPSLCGVEWGGLINFAKSIWFEYATLNQLGHDLSICDEEGRHMGYDGYAPFEKCDLVHIGTSGTVFTSSSWTIETLCQELPVLSRSVHCPNPESSSNAPVPSL